MTKEAIEALAPLTQEGEYLLFSGEVLLAFYESGRLKAKAMAFEDVRDIAPAASLPMEKIKKLKQGTEIDKVQAMIGAEGLEIMRMNLSDEDSSGVRRVLAWKDDDGEAVEMLFELDDNEWVLFAVVEIPVKPEQQMGNT